MTRPRKPAERKDRPNSLTQAVLRAVYQLGECSVARVTAEVAWIIGSAQAVAECNRRARFEEKRGRRIQPQNDSITQGKRWIVGTCLSSLKRGGKVIRVRWGVYGPVPPKVYNPAAI